MRVETMSLVFGPMSMEGRAKAVEEGGNDLCKDIEQRGYEVVSLQALPCKSPTGEADNPFRDAPEVVEDGIILVATYRRPAKPTAAQALAAKQTG